MKKLLTSLAGMVLSVVISMNSSAQNNERLSKFGESENSNTGSLSSNSSNLKGTISHSAEIFSARALEHFQNVFHTVTDVRWVSSKNDISASFVQDGIRTNVTYNKKGRWLNTFIYYPGYKLDPSLRSLVLTDYLKYEIVGVTEIHLHKDVIYSVSIQNEKNVKKLILCDGRVSVFQEFQRAN